MIQFQFMPDVFLERLNMLMKEKKIGCKRLGKALGLSITTVQEWKMGHRTMFTPSFFKLCKYFNVDPLWLYGETDERKEYGA